MQTVNKMQNLTTFWKKESKSIFWFKKPKKILFKKKFFTDGKCNIAFNCLKKNILENKGDKIGIVTIDENCNALQFSYKELENLVDNFITFLRSNFKDKDLRKNIISIHSSANIISDISMSSLITLSEIFKYRNLHSSFREDLLSQPITL